jgi:hypothetical protein
MEVILDQVKLGTLSMQDEERENRNIGACAKWFESWHMKDKDRTDLI